MSNLPWHFLTSVTIFLGHDLQASTLRGLGHFYNELFLIFSQREEPFAFQAIGPFLN